MQLLSHHELNFVAGGENNVLTLVVTTEPQTTPFKSGLEAGAYDAIYAASYATGVLLSPLFLIKNMAISTANGVYYAGSATYNAGQSLYQYCAHA